MSLAYPNEKSKEVKVFARDSFLEALDDPTFHLRVLERDPPTIDEALQIAIRLEAYEKSMSPATEIDAKYRKKNVVRSVESSCESRDGLSDKIDLVLTQLAALKAEQVQMKAEMEVNRHHEDLQHERPRVEPSKKKSGRATVEDTTIKGRIVVEDVDSWGIGNETANQLELPPIRGWRLMNYRRKCIAQVVTVPAT
jgi:hypothetical protein